MAKMIHTMIRVLNPQVSIDFYQRTLGLSVSARFAFDDFTLIYLRNDESDFELELTHNHNRTEAYTHGSGYGHLAVSVEDSRALHAELVAMGETPTDVKTFSRNDEVLGRFFFLTDPDGYQIEVVERLGRYALQ